MSRTRRLLVLLLAVVALGGLGVALLAPSGGSGTPAAEPSSTSVTATRSPSPSPVAAARRPGVLVVGDAVVAGPGVTASFPRLAAATMGWSCWVDAAAGTGYAAGDAPYAARLPAVVTRVPADRVDYVIVAAGRADRGRPDLGTAALAYLRAVRARYPRASLVVLAPFSSAADPPPSVVAARTAVRGAALSVRARYLDTSGWLTPAVIGPDGVLPTAAGQRRMAGRLVAGLRDQGFAPAATPAATAPGASPSAPGS